MPTVTETIAAIATPPGYGGIGIIRVSGPDAAAVLTTLVRHEPVPRKAQFGAFLDADGTAIDHGLTLWFPGPDSYTGEDVVEFQGHGGPVILDMLLQRIYRLGVRPARPGEFTERAYLNDKMDLAQAESVADLINSATESAARGALRSLQGEFSTAIDELVEELLALRSWTEAVLDFPDEDLDHLDWPAIRVRLDSLRSTLRELNQQAERGSRLREGLRIVIVGRPNVGKSSLMNVLARQDRAIVTPIAGTTRDLLHEQLNIDGVLIQISDTAGLRQSGDPIEQAGMARTWQAAKDADRVLYLIDSQQGLDTVDRENLDQLSNATTTLVYNKVDLCQSIGSLADIGADAVLQVSAKTGAGIDTLIEHIKQLGGFQQAGNSVLSARRRHLVALAAAQQAIDKAATLCLRRDFELAAEELRLARNELEAITGKSDNDELLSRIFSEFCIGK